ILRQLGAKGNAHPLDIDWAGSPSSPATLHGDVGSKVCITFGSRSPTFDTSASRMRRLLTRIRVHFECSAYTPSRKRACTGTSSAAVKKRLWNLRMVSGVPPSLHGGMTAATRDLGRVR